MDKNNGFMEPNTECPEYTETPGDSGNADENSTAGSTITLVLSFGGACIAIFLIFVSLVFKVYETWTEMRAENVANVVRVAVPAPAIEGNDEEEDAEEPTDETRCLLDQNRTKETEQACSKEAGDQETRKEPDSDGEKISKQQGTEASADTALQASSGPEESGADKVSTEEKDNDASDDTAEQASSGLEESGTNEVSTEEKHNDASEDVAGTASSEIEKSEADEDNDSSATITDHKTTAAQSENPNAASEEGSDKAGENPDAEESLNKSGETVDSERNLDKTGENESSEGLDKASADVEDEKPKSDQFEKEQ